MSRDLERALREARATLPLPSQRATARARALVLGRAHLRLRLTIAAAALVLATLSGIGVGLWVAPSGGATEPASGLGFLPVPGWTVLQSGTLGPLEATTAVAANVAIHPEDADGGLPYRTLQSLPRNGIVMTATFTPAFPPGGDYPASELPLRVADFPVDRGWSAQARSESPLGQRNYRGAVKGYHVNVHVYFGTAAPSPDLLAAAQRQLDRLVVAGDAVTIRLQPTLARWGSFVLLDGAIASGRANEDVVLEERRCGSSDFYRVAELHTGSGGTWHANWGPVINATYRARWKGATSDSVALRVRPSVTLRQKSRSEFVVSILALRRFDSRQGVLERFDAARRRWVVVRRFTFETGGAAGISVGTGARVRATVPRKALVRVVLPLTSARPCYLAGYSNMLRTW